jgi:FkbM family methyltransferase
MAEGWRRPVLDAARALNMESALRQAQYAFAGRTERRDLRDNERIRSLIRLTLAADASAIDIGANVGDVLREIVDTAPHGRHVAYEPLPDLAADLAARFKSVEVHTAAVSDAQGTAEFHRHKEKHPLSSLSTRGLPPDALESITVQIETLDSLPTDFHPALIKIDVEGAEAGVFRGARRLLRDNRPVIIFEHGEAAAAFGTTSGEIHDLLSELGYRLFDIDANGPFTRAQFQEVVGKGRVWTFVAHV